MKKFIVIPDLHGSYDWKEILGFVDMFDDIIFIGDYTDSYDYSDIQIKDNFIQILEFKYRFPKKVHLLLGNHDLPYMFSKIGQRTIFCQGHRAQMRPDMYQLFHDAYRDGAIKLAHEIHDKNGTKFLFTHAGVTEGWWNFVSEREFTDDHRFAYLWKGDDKISTKLNLLLDIKCPFVYANSFMRGGSSYHGGLLWADISEMERNPLKGYHHIVGHTKVNDIYTFDFDEDTKVTFIDVIDNDNNSTIKFFVGSYEI
jgi:predicted phosphodiesterase